MNHEAETKKYLDILVPIIKTHVKNCSIYLYGSRARGDCNRSSDVDIALDCTSAIQLHILSQIKADIDESSIPVLVDIVDLHGVSESMKNEILKKGILWKS